MARIRSIHPGLFTDEAFVTLSPLARVLLLGIWTESDDHGVFEWKPITLKMRLLPADNVDVATLLEEIVASQVIKMVNLSGKDYGLVRNFCRFQRPKKPTYRVDVGKEWWKYIGLNDDGTVPHSQSSPSGTEPVGKESPTPSESRPQREEVRGNRSGRREKPSAKMDKNFVVVEGGSTTKTTTESENRIEVKEDSFLPRDWLPAEAGIEFAHQQGMTDAALDEQIISFKAYNHGLGSMSPAWPDVWVRWCIKWKEKQPKKAPPRYEVNREIDWDGACKRFVSNKGWPREIGGEPGMVSCRCPHDIQRKHGIDPSTGLKLREAAS